MKKTSEMNLKLTDSGHLLGIEVVGDAVLVRDVVVEVSAPGLDRAHVEFEVLPLGGLGFLARVALSEETPGPCEVEGGVGDLGDILRTA